MATHPVFLPGEFHGQRSLVAYGPYGHKESDMTDDLAGTEQCFFHFNVRMNHPRITLKWRF